MEKIRKCSWTLVDLKRLVDIGIYDVKTGFMEVGYYLKYIRDEKLWKEEHSSFDAFMAENYSKDKSWASRCINLYEQFGAAISPGDVPRLDERYAGYNTSQLIEMLSIPEEQRGQITPEMKVKEIREMKPKRKKPDPPAEEVAISQLEQEESLGEPPAEVAISQQVEAVSKEHEADATDEELEQKRRDDWKIRCEVLKQMCDSICRMRSFTLENSRYSMVAIRELSNYDHSFGFGNDGRGNSRYAADCKNGQYHVKELWGNGRWIFQAGEIEQQIWNVNARDWKKEHCKEREGAENLGQKADGLEPSALETEQPGDKPEEVQEPEGVEPAPESQTAMTNAVPTRPYSLADVEKEIATHQKRWEIIAVGGIDAPITGQTRMRLDALRLLRAQMEERMA